MSRQPRSSILSEFNHIMIRGIGHMDLFYTDEDYKQFIDTLKRFHKENGVSVIAYCLMSNHVHLLIQASPDSIPLFFKRVGVSYVSYFNGIYEHTGHLFQNRYKSEPITDESYFLCALKYILLNPEKAGISRWKDYKWSSARSYLSLEDDNLTDRSLALQILNGSKELYNFIEGTNTLTEFAITEPAYKRKTVTDSQAILIIKKISGIHSPTDIQSIDKITRNKIICQLKEEGMTIRQIERLTGINRNIIQRLK